MLRRKLAAVAVLSLSTASAQEPSGLPGLWRLDERKAQVRFVSRGSGFELDGDRLKAVVGKGLFSKTLLLERAR